MLVILYDEKQHKFIGNSISIPAKLSKESSDVWTYKLNTNQLITKFDKNFQYISIVFEFVNHMVNQDKI